MRTSFSWWTRGVQVKLWDSLENACHTWAVNACNWCTAMRPHTCNSDPATTTLAARATARIHGSRSLFWSFNVWPAKHRRTCQTIASLSLTPDRAVSGHRIHCRVSFDVHTTRMVTGAWPLQGRGSGTLPAELQQCSSLRQFKRCLKTFLWRLVTLCKTAPYRNSLTYLLT